MKHDLMGLILAENSEAAMGELTAVRPLAAVPFGGRYRMIDFMLSCMVNSAIVNVGIITPYNFRSLSDHLGTGKDWDIDRKGNGLFLLPSKEMSETGEVSGGIDILNGITYHLNKCKQEYVLVSSCNTICNINFAEVFKTHIDTEADITLIYTEVGELNSKDLASRVLVDADDTGRVRDIHVFPLQQKTNNVYMQMFIVKKDLLLELIGDAVAHNKHHISKDIFLPNLERLKIYGYKFEGYNRHIDNVKAFFDTNLELLECDIRKELFGIEKDMPIYTKIKDSVSTKYSQTSEVSNSFIADGCLIEGTVKNSILFRGVHVGKGATVENCILMQKSEVMDNCMLENVIFDKEVILRSGKKLVGQDTYPMVIGKNTVI